MGLSDEDRTVLTAWRVRAHFHEARAGVLDATVQLDRQLDQTVATTVARSARSRAALLAVLPRLRGEERLGLLEESVEEELLADEFPFLLPVARKLYDVRNVIAHATEVAYLPGDEGAGPAVVFETYRRGKSAERIVPLGQMRWLTRSAVTVVNNLTVTWARALLEEDGNPEGVFDQA